jgi:hypothetical protein
VPAATNATVDAEDWWNAALSEPGPRRRVFATLTRRMAANLLGDHARRSGVENDPDFDR